MKTLLKHKMTWFYMVLILACCASFVFSNVSYDSEYQMAMAYRLIQGDEMVLQMWEPHQTSAFLCAILMWIYMSLTGTTTGIVLFLQIAGLLIRAGIGYLIYREIKEMPVENSEIPGFLAGITYLLISPKELLTPEFGNMQLWFGTLVFLTLIRYFKTEKIWCLFAGAVCFCLGVFSYPSFLLVSLGVIAAFMMYSKHKIRDIGIYLGVGLVIGGTFVAYLLMNVGFETALNCVSAALAVEPSHTVGAGEKVLGHVLNIGKTFGMLLGIGAIGALTEVVAGMIRKLSGKETFRFVWREWLMISWFVLMGFLLWNILSVENRGGYAFPFLVILILGYLKHKLLAEEEKRMYFTAFWISSTSLVATLVLSDNAFIQAVTYMLVWICVSLLPVYRYFLEIKREKQWRKLFLWGMHIFFLLIIFRCIYIHIPLHGRSQIISLTDELAIIRSGPGIGIISDEDGVARQRDSMAEWSRYISPGDKVWIVGEPVDTLGYLYEDVEVAAPTVMSTPTYNEELLYYWELNPEKYPDVVVVSSAFGELSWEVLSNEWLLKWLEEEYPATQVIDGNYWRYYLKE